MAPDLTLQRLEHSGALHKIMLYAVYARAHSTAHASSSSLSPSGGGSSSMMSSLKEALKATGGGGKRSTSPLQSPMSEVDRAEGIPPPPALQLPTGVRQQLSKGANLQVRMPGWCVCVWWGGG